MDVARPAPFSRIDISLGHPGQPTAQTTWTETDTGATGAVTLQQTGVATWTGGDTNPMQGSYSVAFSSVSADAGAADLSVHGTWSATAPAASGASTALTLNGVF